MTLSSDHDFELDRQPLTAVILDSNVTLQFGQAREFGLRIEVDFVCEAHPRSGRVHVSFDPYQNPAPVVTGINELAELINTTVKDVRIAEDGVLTILFENGASVEIPRSDDYEAWSFSGSGRTLTSMPGGEVTEF